MKQAAAAIWWEKLLSCTLYCICSASMVLVNKSIDNIFGFKTVFALIFWQNLATWVLLWLARAIGLISFPMITGEFVIKWIPVEFVFSTMLVSSILSLKYLTTNIIVIFKNLTNILTAICDWYFFGNKPNFYTIVSLSLMVLSSLIAGFSDLYFHPVGYFWMFINCLMTASNTILLKRIQNQLKQARLEQGRFGTPFWNNLLSMPALLTLVLAWGEHTLVVDTVKTNRNVWFWAILVFSGLLGTFQSITSLWTLKATSATTYAMVGALNKIPTSIVGLLLFHTKVTPLGYFSMFIGIGSGILYSWANQIPRPPAKKDPPQSSTTSTDAFTLHVESLPTPVPEIPAGSPPPAPSPAFSTALPSGMSQPLSTPRERSSDPSDAARNV